MTYSVQPTKNSKYALVSSDGRLVHPFDSELAAQTACDSMNRASYEPVISPYLYAEGGCGRWDRMQRKKVA